ncbi:hypothetical protein, partial [Methylobacterium sp. WL30]|uniref:hypothetical protein n=1 Tax=Methylobacterium sp. WL30 TaxID=2603895 RepID=UPI001AED871D
LLAMNLHLKFSLQSGLGILRRNFLNGVSNFNNLAHPWPLMRNVLHQFAPENRDVLSASTHYESTL